jgi:predicted CXXCH cytochrome family protein
MSCTSCHDPHFTPEPSQKAAFFRAKCLACHSRPDFAANHHPESKDCTSCHMPRNGAQNIPHVAWTDHRILAQPAELAPQSTQQSGADFTPIFSPSATARDLAMANYQALLEGDRSCEPIAWEELNADRDLIADDKAALDALGNLSAERGDLVDADKDFRRVLTIDPNDLTALSNLGVLLAKEGKLNLSASMLEKAFDRNQDIPGLSMNLARVQCAEGEEEEAERTLITALNYCRNLEDMRRLLTQMSSCVAATK